MDKLHEEILSAIEQELPKLQQIAKTLYDNPEIGGEEKLASSMLVEYLRSCDYTVEEDYWHTRYAFKAVFDSGKPGPSIGIFAEYDALPGIGHGCGHNLICTSSIGAAIGLRQVLPAIGGKVIVFGTPGEENIQTKTLMAPEGAFDEADVAMMVHPEPSMTAVGGKTLAIESLQTEFFGKPSHAGNAPEKGINALDAAVQFYQMIAMEKQYYPDTNVYGIINEGGEKASMIPPYASLKFLNRAWDMETLEKLKEMMVRCAESAAKMTGCTYHMFNNETTNASLKSNQAMSAVFEKHLRELGETEIQHVDLRASTDMGDVSQRIPSIHPWLNLNCPDAALHSEELREATMAPYAAVYLKKAAAAMALTAAEIIQEPLLFEEIKTEFAKK